MSKALHPFLYRFGSISVSVIACCCLLTASCAKTSEHSQNIAARGANRQSTIPLAVTSTNLNLVQIPRSVFSTNVEEGRDPFFPNSTRRLSRSLQSLAMPVHPIQPASTFLKLMGLWPNKSRPLALINRTTIAPGEEANITVVLPPGQNAPEVRKLLVRCLEVRATSVVISIDGEPGTKELILQSRF